MADRKDPKQDPYRGFNFRIEWDGIQQGGFREVTGIDFDQAPTEYRNGDEPMHVRKLPARLRALVWLSGGQIRWRTIATVLDSGYADAFRLLHPDLVGSTFPTWDPHIRLDYLFVPEVHARHVQGCAVLDNADVRGASDHLPLMAEIDG